MNKIISFISILCCLLCATSNATQAKNISVVVFDFGGVIANADTLQMSHFLMTSFNIDQEELSNALRNMQDYIKLGGLERDYWEQFAQSKGISLPDDWISQWATVIEKSITEIPETIAIVKDLQAQGYITAMLSDVTQYQAEIIRKMGYYELFNPVLLSYKTGVKKPNPKAFEILLDTLQKPASQVLFIDDRLENVEAAKALGIDSIQFENPKQLHLELVYRGF